MRKTKHTGEQSRLLRSRLLGKMMLSLIIWTAGFGLVCALIEVYVADDVGNWIADQTAPWSYLSPENVDIASAQTNAKDLPIGDLASGQLTSDEQLALYEELSAQEQLAVLYDEYVAKYGSSENMQVMLTDDGRIASRDLSVYNALRSMKIPLALVIYAIGVIVIIVRTLNRSISYSDELADAIGDPRLIEGKRIELPKELTIASQQIELLQRKMRDHEQAAVMAEQRKNELVAYLAHDIRTPLTSVVGYLSLLAESPDLPRDKRIEFAGIALAKAERLETLVEEFFEITRYNLDAILLERENIDIALFLDQVADEFGISAQERGLPITTIAPEGEHAFIDSSKMARALGNVVKNAVAYADPNTEVTLSALIEEDELVLSTTNKGREISAVHLEAIFERFYRADRSRGQSANAGLGLAIAREIVEAHGGTIAAKSTGGLTTFTIRLPH